MMLKLLRSTLSLFLAAMLAVPCTSWADTNEELKARVEKLEKLVADLKAELGKVKEDVPVQALEAVSKTVAKSESPVEKFAKDIQMHGFVDSAYIFNANTPSSPNSTTNNLRVFDRSSNGFMLNMAEINFSKPTSMESPIGFRVDLDYGEDAQVIGSAGFGSTSDEFDLKQAYAELLIPYSFEGMSTLSFKGGKFATLVGAEVIESINNWNYSRSFLFGYAIPFTHTGLRAYYKPFSNIPVDSYIGIVNGWDVVRDNNKAKTIEAMVSAYPTDNLSFSLGGLFGPERADSNKDSRNLIDLVATYKPFDKLTLKANYDYGWETNGTSDSVGLDDPKSAYWTGFAGYAKYDILDWWSFATRAEYFHDMNGVRTGAVSSGYDDLNLWEVTLTNEFKVYKNLIFRLEYRHDGADHNVFTKNKIMNNYQDTFTCEVIAYF